MLFACCWSAFASGQTTNFGTVSLNVERVASGCPAPCERDLVIFVHGILGARATWENSEAKTYWPALMISDPDLAGVDIMRVDYESYMLRRGPSIEEVLADLQKALESVDTGKYRTVQFIAHSLGGNLVRRYLVHVNSAYGHKYLSRYRMVIMLGTPGQGSYLATVAGLASNNQQLRVLIPIQRNDWLQMLNATLSDIETKHHGTYCSSLLFFAGVETRATTVGIVVDAASASTGAQVYEKFDRDHITLVKPADINDEVYRWTKNIILSCSRGQLCQGPHRSTMSSECGNVNET
jgi:pimeloyl-ACP methyl ester carboxylesterase